MKIVTVLGARPQFIKAATLSRVFKNESIQEIIVHTGQHYDQNMSDVFFDEMQIPRPNHFLQIMSKHHGEMTGKMLEGVEKILLAEKPDAVLVYGDTNSTLAGALAASKLHISLAHVEAGLRSFNKKMPEEINRILTDHVSDWLFVPTDSAIGNLRNEGIPEQKIHKVGDVMLDAILHFRELSDQKSTIVQQLNLEPDNFALVTIHRAENTNDRTKLTEILTELDTIAKNKTVVFPMHPRTRTLLGNDLLLKNIMVLEPVGYLDMLALQSKCRLIITDSGGVQKEAFVHGKYCITVREQTEWVELIENGFNFLAEIPEKIQPLAEKVWDKSFNAGKFQPYGDGKTAERIVNILRSGVSVRASVRS